MRSKNDWDSTAAEVRCRPGKTDRQKPGIVCFLALYPAAMGWVIRLPSPHSLPSPLSISLWLWGVSAVFLLGALLYAIRQRHVQILADEDGLHWQGLYGRHSIPWAGVGDFYEMMPVKGSRTARRFIIETRAGRFQLRSDWSDVERLRDTIAQRATHAREWGVRGTRREDAWPQSFGYDTLSNRTTPWLCVLGSLGCFAYFGPMSVTWAISTAALMGWAWTLVAGLVWLFLIGSLLLAPLFVAISFRRVWARHEQKVIAHPDGIRFQEQGRTMEAPWADVTNYLMTAAHGETRYVVQTRHGDFDFLFQIERVEFLKEIIKRYAVNAAASDWEWLENTEALGGVAAKWSGGQEGVGQRIYHYQTRTNRLFLWAGAVILFGLELIYVINTALGLSSTGGAGLPLGLSLVGAAGLHWANWQFRRVSVRTDDHGITEYHLLGRRHLAWQDVQDYYWAGGESSGRGVVAGTNGRITFSRSVVDAKELQAEITRRAVHSRSREWKEKGKE